MSNCIDTTSATDALPSDRAFLLQFRYNSGTSEDVIKGRIEHITSGNAMKFQSEEELIEWIRSILELM